MLKSIRKVLIAWIKTGEFLTTCHGTVLCLHRLNTNRWFSYQPLIYSVMVYILIDILFLNESFAYITQNKLMRVQHGTDFSLWKCIPVHFRSVLLWSVGPLNGALVVAFSVPVRTHRCFSCLYWHIWAFIGMYQFHGYVPAHCSSDMFQHYGWIYLYTHSSYSV